MGCYNKDIQVELLDKSAPSKPSMRKLNSSRRWRAVPKLDAIWGESSVTAQRSAYKKAGKTSPDKSPKPRRQKDCAGCGSLAHGPGTDLPRREHCPARAQKCGHCLILGHTETVCPKKKSGAAPATHDPPQQAGAKAEAPSHTSAIRTIATGPSWLTNMTSVAEQAFTSTCHAVNSSRWRGSDRRASTLCQRIIIPHMEWNHASARFTTRTPHQMPINTVKVELLRGGHASFHRPILPSATSTHTELVADTGAQTCASGPHLLTALGLEESDLIPTFHRIKGVTKSYLEIQGVLLAQISMGEWSTQQVIYICENASGLYLSEQALRDLGCIPASFPRPGE